ncbi:MAG: hypothetical protein J7K32_04250 [Deltaproteobacteria bacterium]|nr:hypothetical protein [Deltaproteobacteria bacterium]
MSDNKTIIQIVWGALLCAAGLGVFFYTPQKIAEIEKIGSYSSNLFFIRFSFYLIGILLLGGGIKKIFKNFRDLHKKDSE